MNEKIELYKIHVQKQENYVYYLIAISVASIGFVVVQTHEKEFEFNMIPLGFSVISWGLSIFIGLRYLKIVMSLIFKNIQQHRVFEGANEFTGSHPVLIKAGGKILGEMIETDNEQLVKLFIWQSRLFYSGIICYMVWHLYGMFDNTF